MTGTLIYRFQELHHGDRWWSGVAEIEYDASGAWEIGDIDVTVCEDDDGDHVPYTIPASLADALASQHERRIDADILEVRACEPTGRYAREWKRGFSKEVA